MCHLKVLSVVIFLFSLLANIKVKVKPDATSLYHLYCFLLTIWVFIYVIYGAEIEKMLKLFSGLLQDLWII